MGSYYRRLALGAFWVAVSSALTCFFVLRGLLHWVPLQLDKKEHALYNTVKGVSRVLASRNDGFRGGGDALHGLIPSSQAAKSLRALVRNVPLKRPELYANELEVLSHRDLLSQFIQDSIQSHYIDLMHPEERRSLELFWRTYYSDSLATPKQARTLGYRAIHDYLMQLTETYVHTVAEVSRLRQKADTIQISRVRLHTLKMSYEKAFTAADLRGLDDFHQPAKHPISGNEKQFGRRVLQNPFPEPRDLVASLQRELKAHIEVTD